MERKLAALLSADVAGYSRLVEDDDEATVATLTRYRALMHALVAAHHGRVVDSPGDNLLAEFPSVVDAVRGAVEIQHRLAQENAALEPSRRMHFRIGINSGDIIVEDDRVYGDGVNLAARLEALAEPGGICLSSTAYEQAGNKVAADYAFIGEHAVKNFSKPVGVWRVLLTGERASEAPAGAYTRVDTASSARAPGRIALALSAVIVVLLGAASWYAQRETAPVPAAPGLAPAVAANPQSSSVAVTARPAIMVLPFANLSDDPEQAYFSDGITEDITTDLSKLRELFVVSSVDAYKHKDRATDSAALRAEFAIRYLLEGSVRKAGEQIRISVRLLDLERDEHIWSERYDRPFTEIFALQDDIRRKILTALKVKLSADEQERFQRARTDNLEAYDYYLRAAERMQRARSELRPELMHEAIAMLQRAISLDTAYAAAYSKLGLYRWILFLYKWTDDLDAALDDSNSAIEKAIALDPDNPAARRVAVNVAWRSGDYEQARTASDEYVRLFPDDPDAHRMHAFNALSAGDGADALSALARARALTPGGKIPPYAYWYEGVGHLLQGELGKAKSILTKATTHSPNYITNHLVLSVVLMKLGNKSAAEQEVEEVLRISPQYKAEHFRQWIEFQDEAVTDDIIGTLRLAGLP